MGVGPIAIRVYKQLLDLGLLRPGMSMLELGSQTLEIHRSEAAVAALKEIMARFGVKPLRWDRHYPSYLVMLELGFSYTSIDIDGERWSQIADLNTPLPQYHNKFDLVTNFGTTEHVFNQAQCFETIHSACKKGGLIIHCVPMRGYMGHAFYLYDPNLFRDMAKANNYDIIGLWVSLDDQGYTYPELVPEREYRTYAFPPAKKGWLSLQVVFRKTGDAAFRPPTQAIYA